MKYMLLIYGNDQTWQALSGEDAGAEVMRAHAAVITDLRRSGELVDTQGLTTVAARTVRMADGVPAVTDGPFSEAKEVLAGYYLVDCTLERATEIAARLPEARYSPIEIRQVMGMPEIEAGLRG